MFGLGVRVKCTQNNGVATVDVGTEAIVMGAVEARVQLGFPAWSNYERLGFIWTPKVCKTMAEPSKKEPRRPLFYMLPGSRYRV